MKLSKRLETIASLVPKGIPCADIGSDHGLLVSYLMDNKIVPCAYASDNKKGPYSNLLENLSKRDDFVNIEVSLQDGLNNLPTKYKTVIIAGMGGELIQEIIDSSFEKLKNIDYLLLAPHGREKNLRKYLTENGFYILDEEIVFEDHFYEIILFKKGNKTYTTYQLEYGPHLLKKKSKVFYEKYLEKINSLQQIFNKPSLSEKRKNDINAEIVEYQKMLAKEFNWK